VTEVAAAAGDISKNGALPDKRIEPMARRQGFPTDLGFIKTGFKLPWWVTGLLASVE